MRTRTLKLGLIIAGVAACEPLDIPRDVMGNFAVDYQNNLRVYINDELVAEAREGEDPEFDWNGEVFTISQLCGQEGTTCPSDTLWNEVAVDQPWGSEYSLLNFVNLDQDDPDQTGIRLGGGLDESGDFAMLSGFAVGADENCAAIGIGTVLGRFAEQATAIDDGVLIYEWAGGCSIAGIELGATLRLESDFTASRTGDFDLSSLAVEADEPIDEEGAAIDPESPDASYERPAEE